MANGRPSGTRLDPEHPDPVLVEVCEIDERGRVRLPPRITSGVEWFEGRKFDCLMVLDEPGRVILLPWKPYGDEVVEKRREIIEELSKDSTEREFLSALTCRYHRISIPSDSRPYVGSFVLLHLGFPEGISSRAYLIQFPDSIEIVSREFYLKACRKFLSQFPDLP